MLRELIGTAGYKVRAYRYPREFLSEFEPDRHGCVVLDVRMPEIDGFAVQRELAGRGNTTPIIVITGHADVPMAVDAVKRGAFDFIQKPFRSENLLSCVRAALALSARQRREAQERAAMRSRLAALTPRERQVMTRVVAGRTTKQIAAEFHVTTQAIDAHRARLMSKLDVSGVAELVRLVMAADGKHRTPVG